MSEFSKTLAIIGILAPLGAGAMGIGDIRSHSALNQTLNAEIPLVLSRADKLDTIQVRLASPEAFDKAGVERLYALTQLRFRPVAKHDGRYAIQVSSNDVIQEPFLDFLVEVESPQGKLLREFTLLLDPPGGITQAATGQISTSDLSPPRQDAEFDDPASYNPPPPPARATPGYAEPYLQDEAPSRPAFRPAISLEQLTGQTYGPVRRRETLFEIASRVDRPHSVTAGQMATALYLANPRAFSGNIHGLRAGSILRIPTEDFIASVGPEGTGGTPSGSKAMGRPRPDYDDSMARNQSSTTGKATAPYQPPRGYSFGAGAGSADGAGAVAEVSSRVPSALKKENEELRERLTQLEQQLEEAQRMLVLKNAELASLQSHQSHPAESDEPAQPAKPALPPASNESARGATPAETSAPVPVASVPPVQSAAPSSTIAPLPKPTVALMPTENPSEESPMAPGYWLASGGLILLGLGAWLFRRRLGEVNTILRGGIAQEPTGEGLANPDGYSEPSFELSGDLDTATLDPQWEANVYLRYGRYPQAESLIREAIKQAPEQHDLKLKLFEIFIHANNPDAFRAYAREIQEGVKHLPVTFWSTVHAMRPEWLPPEITSEVLSAPAAADSEVAASSAHAPPVQDEADALDIEDTDFTAELRALEAQYAEPERQHPNTESADTAPTRDKELVLELTGDESGGGDTQAFTPPALASPTGTSSTDSVAAAGSESTAAAAGSESTAVLPADILADSDTDFTEALRALEAQ
ncbi:MAG: hypothetical protein LUO80_00555, partial [Methylococcaceae bacterium]|nr:hypothetical protein [Methylococcaceae bacterium]